MRLGLFLALWSLAFAGVHVAWALGWRAGVAPDVAPISDRPWFLAYDLVSGTLMVAAAAIAWALARDVAAVRTRHHLVLLTFVGSALALARGLPALVWDGVVGAPGLVSVGADIWFTVAGLTGVALALVVRRPAVGEAPGGPHASGRLVQWPRATSRQT